MTHGEDAGLPELPKQPDFHDRGAGLGNIIRQSAGGAASPSETSTAGFLFSGNSDDTIFPAPMIVA